MPTREDIEDVTEYLSKNQNHLYTHMNCEYANYVLAEAYREEHDKTPLTVEHLRQNNFEANSDWEFILRRPQRRIWVSASGSVSSWDWMIDFLILPCYLKPTTLGDLRQLIRKLEGGAG